ALEYEWDFNGEGSSSEREPSFAFTSSGAKTISVYSSIPGCESSVTEQTIEIFPSPQTDFTATSVCVGDLTCFTNLSETAQYSWDFGDGFMSTDNNPDHLFLDAGTYTVSLSSTNETGCVNIVSKQITVSPLPVADFSFDLVCKDDPSTFQDLSFATQSEIIAWDWQIDGESTSLEQEPVITFQTSGLHTVSLTVLAANGCSETYSEDIDVLGTPNLVIGSQGNCLNEPVSFEDMSENQENVQVRSWFVDGLLIEETEATFDYQFVESGTHEVQMIVDQTTGCSSSTSILLEILESPSLTFATNTLCENEDVIVSDLTQNISGNEITSRVWMLDDGLFGNGIEALLPKVEGGSHILKLISTTSQGCELTLEETIEIADSPEIRFTPSSDYGIPPFNLKVEDQSNHVADYAWYLDNLLVSTQSEPTIAIFDEGQKQLKLVAKSISGCVDSLETLITSALPQVDLEINQMQLVENGNTNNILLEITNKSNIPIEILNFNISLENKFELSEQVINRLNIDQQSVITLSTGIPGTLDDLGYLCVSVNSPYQVEDLTPINNESCRNIAIEDAVFEPPFPNPAKNNFVIRGVIPKSGMVRVSLMDMSGQVVVEKYLNEIPSGLNVFNVDLQGLDMGTYLVHIRYSGGEYKYRVIKR
ncbi:MAG: PKD domain-containing protein, partial [Cyclobacteriaceae bacterium]